MQRGGDIYEIIRRLKVSEKAARKIKEQFYRFGKVFPPKRDYDNTTMPVMTAPNSDRPLKQTGQHVRIIKNILYELVREGKMTSLE
jgi:hypothetical protein